MLLLNDIFCEKQFIYYNNTFGKIDMRASIQSQTDFSLIWKVKPNFEIY